STHSPSTVPDSRPTTRTGGDGFTQRSPREDGSSVPRTPGGKTPAAGLGSLGGGERPGAGRDATAPWGGGDAASGRTAPVCVVPRGGGARPRAKDTTSQTPTTRPPRTAMITH